MVILCLSAFALLAAQDGPRELIEKLRSDRVEEREQAVRALRRLSEVPPELEKAAQDSDPEVAAQVRGVLRFFEIRRSLSPRLRAAVPGIEERLAAGGWVEALLEASDPARRKAPLEREDLEVLAAPALRQVRTEEEREQVVEIMTTRRLRSAIPELVVLLQSPREGTRDLAQGALTELDAREAVKDVAGLLGHVQAYVRMCALDLLVELKAREYADRVAALLTDPERHVRARAVSSLADLRGDARRPEIRKRLADEEASVRSAAAHALWSLNDPEIAALIEPLLKDPASSVRRDVLYIYEAEMGPKAVPALIRLLEDPNDDIRLIVLERLGRHPEALPVDRVRGLFSDRNEKVRTEALSILVQRKDPSALPEIQARLRAGKPETRNQALQFLRTLKPDGVGREARPLLRDPDSAVRTVAASVLADLEGAGAVPALLPGLEDENVAVVLSVARTLAGLKAKEAVPPFLVLLEKRHPELDQALLPLLVQIQGLEAVPTLLKGLESPSDAIREGSATQLRVAGAGPHVQALKALLRSERPEVRRTALEAFWLLPGKEQLPPAMEMLGDPDASVQERAASIVFKHGDASFAARVLPLLASPAVRGEAALALSRWKDRESVAGIRALLKDSDADVRHSAIEALMALGAKEAAPDLLPLLDAEEPFLRGAVLIALEEFGVKVERAARLELERLEQEPFSKMFSFEEGPFSRPRLLRALHRLGSPIALRELLRSVAWRGLSPPGEEERALREIGLERVMPVVLGMLTSSDPVDRMTAVDALAILGGRSQAGELARRLADPHEGVRVAAVEGLVEIGARDAAPEIARGLGDRFESVRSVSAAALGRLGAKSSTADLRRLLRDREPEVLLSAADALGRLEAAEAIPDLLPLLDHADGTTRAVAARVLGEMRGAAALGRLRELLRDDEDLHVRESAARALALLEAAPPAGEIAKALEDVEKARAASFQCGVGRRERNPAPWRGEREGPHPFNAVRSPELWERLRKTPLKEDVQGTIPELMRALGHQAGVVVEVTQTDDEDEVPWRRCVRSRGGERSLLDAFHAIAPDSYSLVLEPDRIRILPYFEGVKAWKEWWKARDASGKPR